MATNERNAEKKLTHLEQQYEAVLLSRDGGRTLHIYKNDRGQPELWPIPHSDPKKVASQLRANGLETIAVTVIVSYVGDPLV